MEAIQRPVQHSERSRRKAPWLQRIRRVWHVSGEVRIMTTTDVITIWRVLERIDQLGHRAIAENRPEDAYAMWRLVGALRVRALDFSAFYGELGGVA
jgi:hypothetical protein